MSQSKPAPGNRNHTVLVVEDDEIVRELLRTALAERGFNVGTAENGAKALGVLMHEPVDAAVVDLVMPGMSGFALLDKLRREGRDVPIVLISGYVGMLDAERCRKMGARAVFRKPFVMKNLLAAVEALIAGEELPATLEEPAS
jgi:CheY-like chemotaxis protein